MMCQTPEHRRRIKSPPIPQRFLQDCGQDWLRHYSDEHEQYHLHLREAVPANQENARHSGIRKADLSK